MPQYRQPDIEAAKEIESRVKGLHDGARTASRNSANYVLLTVLFSIAMFFAGIGPQFKRPRARAVLVGIGGLFLAVTLVVLAGYPVASL